MILMMAVADDNLLSHQFGVGYMFSQCGEDLKHSSAIFNQKYCQKNGHRGHFKYLCLPPLIKSG